MSRAAGDSVAQLRSTLFGDYSPVKSGRDYIYTHDNRVSQYIAESYGGMHEETSAAVRFSADIRARQYLHLRARLLPRPMAAINHSVSGELKGSAAN
jgi:hypothetical protein